MAYIHAQHAPAYSTSAIATLNTISNRFFAVVSSWNNVRLTRNSLLQLTDRELEDIGLNRYSAQNMFR